MASKSPITPEGYLRLQAEAERLWRVERPKLTQLVAEAAAQGDRSENADYIYGRRRLREIDSRLRYLGRRLDQLQVVRAGEVRRDRAYFGAFVRLEDVAGRELRYRLVGPDETDVARGWISIESPVGRMLVGRRVGEEVEVERPAGRMAFTILEVTYEE